MSNFSTTEERLDQSPRHVVRYFVLLMSLVYAGMGAWLIWTAGQPEGPVMTHFSEIGLTGNRLRILGVFFILYGLIRFVRSYRANFRNSAALNDNDSLAS